MTSTIYITDNGRLLCHEHLGVTARLTGRDLSGQPIEPVTEAAFRAAGLDPRVCRALLQAWLAEDTTQPGESIEALKVALDKAYASRTRVSGIGDHDELLTWTSLGFSRHEGERP
jgi:hypothetical protein